MPFQNPDPFQTDITSSPYPRLEGGYCLLCLRKTGPALSKPGLHLLINSSYEIWAAIHCNDACWEYESLHFASVPTQILFGPCRPARSLRLPVLALASEELRFPSSLEVEIQV